MCEKKIGGAPKIELQFQYYKMIFNFSTIDLKYDDIFLVILYYNKVFLSRFTNNEAISS